MRHILLGGRVRVLGIAALVAMPAVGSADMGMNVTKTSDSVVDAKGLLLTKSARFGRAINGQSFQGEALLSHDGYQYTAWYRHVSGSSSDVVADVMIARRTVEGAAVGAWEIVNTGSRLSKGLHTRGTNGHGDAHNVISLGLSKQDGAIHLSWDHHGHPLRYRVTAPGVATHNKAAWGTGMFAAETNVLPGSPSSFPNLTYPTFHDTPGGGLHFAFRSDGSGNGDVVLTNYDAGAWGASRIVMHRSGGTYTDPLGTSTSRNAYVNGFDYDAAGRLHTTWTWRETSSGVNHDINYAYSDDGGLTWMNGAGVQVANTGSGDYLTYSDPGLVVKQLDRTQSLYNQVDQSVAADGRVHIIQVHRRPGAEYAYEPGDGWDPLDSAIFHYARDPQTGDWIERMLPTDLPVGTRPAIALDALGNIFAVYTTRDQADANARYSNGNLVIAGATLDSGFTDWSILHVEEVGFEGDPLLDDARLLNDGILSIYVQEDDPRTGSSWSMTGSNLHVLEFAVGIPEPGSTTGGTGGSSASAVVVGDQ